MGRVREYRLADTGDVAQLWAQEFHKRPSVPGAVVTRYFEEMFFSNPWYTEDMPSFVYEDTNGSVIGFLGVIPRPMKFLGKRVQAAVATQLMLDSSKPRGFAALELLRKFFSGPQDLSFSDGTSDLARRVWVAAGGSIAMLYSSVWTRILRPTEYLMSWCENRKHLQPFGRIAKPICWALDAAAIRMTDGPYWLPEPEDTEETPSEDELLGCSQRFSNNMALQPDYNPEAFRWLLKQASEQTTHGDLRKGIVRGAKGEIIGWYLYYVKPGGVAQVLQFGGKTQSIAQVLSQLFYKAWRQGAVAVSGQMEPQFALELSRNRCRFSWPGSVVVHSPNRAILDSICRGDAALTRVDGEWWMRFCDLLDAKSASKYSSWEAQEIAYRAYPNSAEIHAAK